MNKGLFVHLIATVIYVLCVMYIFQEQSPSIGARVLIVFLLFLTQYIVWQFLMFTEYYKQKL